ESGRGEHGDQGSGGGGIRGSGIEAQSRAPVAAVDAGGREGGGVSSDLGWGWFPELQLIGKEVIIVAAGKQLMDDVQSDDHRDLFVSTAMQFAAHLAPRPVATHVAGQAGGRQGLGGLLVQSLYQSANAQAHTV